MHKLARKYINITVLSLFLVTPAFAVSNMNKHREQYQQVDALLDSKKATLEELAPLIASLRNYPLYPYLQFKYLSQSMSTVSYNEVSEYFKHFQSVAVFSQLESRVGKEWVKRKAWKELVSLFEPQNSTRQKCFYHYGQWQLGHKKTAIAAAADIWASPGDLPKDCDPLFALLLNKSTIDVNLLLLRLGEALNKGNTKIAQYVVKLIPDSHKSMRTALEQVINDPAKLPEFARNVSPSAFSRQVIDDLFPKFVRKSVTAAQTALPAIVRTQKISKKDTIELEQHIAAYYIRDNASAEKVKWRDQFLTKNPKGSSIESLIRLSLRNKNYAAVSKWLDHLPSEEAKKDEWRYWKADRLIAKGNTKEGNDILTALTSDRGFYPMLSAQRLGIAYPIKSIQESYPIDKAYLSSLNRRNDINRIRELRHWQLDQYALSEWMTIIKREDPSRIPAFAYYATQQQWGQMAIQSTILGKLWNYFPERFPEVYSSIFKNEVKNKAITYTYAIAIARQESALNKNALSPVGARGLMQLMPATAKETAAQLGLKNYTSVAQLLDPATNIKLGTAYLDKMYKQFNNNRILASAAYNAGPHRVKKWLESSGGQMDAAAFIESIPFTETRNYVKSVLSYDVFYQHNTTNNIVPVLSVQEMKRMY